jgi:hypothetical protein
MIIPTTGSFLLILEATVPGSKCVVCSHYVSQWTAHLDPGTEALKWKKPSQITFDSSFKDACAVEVFRDKWITAKTWAQIIFKHFKLNETLRFNDTDLVKALGLKQSKEKFKKTT